jgi:sugar phosphate isomerase/epimerase
MTLTKSQKRGIDSLSEQVEKMQIGTFARTTEQAIRGLENKPDFIDLRLDYDHTFEFSVVKPALNKEGVACTLHLPSNPEWEPTEISRDIVPYLELAGTIEAELVTFHSPLSTLFYSDEVIDDFLESFPLAYDAARESGVTLAVETLCHSFTELTLFFDQFPEARLVLDIGHGQILSTQNRALEHIETFQNHIEMVNVHDNNAGERYEEVLSRRSLASISREELREMGRQCDEHMPIGEGKLDFVHIFASLKEYQYDARFLMGCSDPSAFLEERRKFLALWKSA